MKRSTLTNYYRVFAALYGVVPSNDAFLIIKKFNPKFLKKDFIVDLKDRWAKQTRDYSVIKLTGVRNEFLITTPYATDNFIDQILKLGEGKPYFIPEGDEEEFFKYRIPKYRDSKFFELLEELKKDADKIFEDPTEQQLNSVYFDIYFLCDVRLFFKNLEENINEGIYPNIKGEKSLELLLEHLNVLVNNKRLFETRGHTPIELAKDDPVLNDPFIILKSMIEAALRKDLINGEDLNNFISFLDIDEELKDKLRQHFKAYRVINL